MRGHPGNELRVFHPLRLACTFSISAADLAVLFIEGEPFQREHRPDQRAAVEQTARLMHLLGNDLIILMPSKCFR